ncbi:MAG: M16 family metallopeptidase [Flavobacteriales bacterium]
MEFYTHTLANGIRIIHKRVKSEVAHFGWMINVGSRDESEKEFGMAHFIEHCLFKGTQKRKMHHILSRMEDVGGELNAYTTKEETYIYASFLKADYKRAIDLISDIVQNSSFPEKEIEKEKEVIIDEINSYKDSPSEQIFDDFDEVIFGKSSIGVNILGDEKSVNSFTREDILHFIEKNYASDKMILSSVGNVSPEKLFAWAETYFGDIESRTSEKKKEEALPKYAVQTISKENAVHQCHCMIGTRAYGATDKKARALILLNNILGGPGLNSRLNMGIREKYGYTYSIESNYHLYSDSGIFSIYFGTDQKYVEKVKKLIFKECQKFIDQPLTDRQLAKAKKQLLGQFYIAQENNCNLMLSMAKSLSVHGEVDSISDVKDKINAISAQDIHEVAKEIFNRDKFSILEFKN